MSIKGFFNGYYRSGTSAIWDSVRKESSIHFYYEPLNKKRISENIYDTPQNNKLHDLYLWEEYHKMDDNLKTQLLIKMKALNLYNKESVNDLFSFYDSFDDDVYMQTNRLDFIPQDSYNTFIHIVRNFEDVYSSFLNIFSKRYFGIYKKFKKIKHRLFNPYLFSEMWNIKEYVEKNIDIFPEFNSALKLSNREYHFLSWLIFNYKICCLEKCKNIIIYESVVQNNHILNSIIKDAWGIDIIINSIKNNESCIDDFYLSETVELSRKLNLYDRYQSLLKVCLK